MAFGARAKSVMSVVDLASTTRADSRSSSSSSSGQQTTKKVEIEDIKVNPLDFDSFLPWACMQWMVKAKIVVNKVKQEAYVPASVKKKPDTTKSKSRMHELGDSGAHILISRTLLDVTAYAGEYVPVTTIYDIYNQLIEIAVVRCPNKIPIEVFRAIYIALRYHTTLNKLTFRRGGLTAKTLKVLGEAIMPNSKITELCLDDTYIKEGNYYVLFEHASYLKYLSLNRCCINDAVVTDIVDRFKIGSAIWERLLTLELASNDITDVGACLLAKILRRNRHLVHLNLAGNRITGDGAGCLIDVLMEFPLTDHEIHELKRRRFDYYKYRLTVYNKYLQEQLARRRMTQSRKSVIPSKQGSKQGLQAKLQRKKSLVLDEFDFAEMMTNQAVGETFLDIYDDNHVVLKKGRLYCTGNFRLASLNLAYNNLDYFTVKKVLQMVQHQGSAMKAPYKGLMRIVLDGNHIPSFCPELQGIEMLLKRVIVENVPVQFVKRKVSLK